MLTVSAIKLQTLEEFVGLLADRRDLDGVSTFGCDFLVESVSVNDLLDCVGENRDQVCRLQGVQLVSIRAVIGDELLIACAFLGFH